jgi:hypothetical protein
VAEFIRATESGQGELSRSEKAYAAADIGVSSGGRSIGGLRLWKVFVTELKPLLGSTKDFAWSMRNSEKSSARQLTVIATHKDFCVVSTSSCFVFTTDISIYI